MCTHVRTTASAKSKARRHAKVPCPESFMRLRLTTTLSISQHTSRGTSRPPLRRLDVGIVSNPLVGCQQVTPQHPGSCDDDLVSGITRESPNPLRQLIRWDRQIGLACPATDIALLAAVDPLSEIQLPRPVCPPGTVVSRWLECHFRQRRPSCDGIAFCLTFGRCLP